jgi:hypothetical protein
VQEAVEGKEACGREEGETMAPMILKEKATNLVTYTYSVKWTVCFYVVTDPFSASCFIPF